MRLNVIFDLGKVILDWNPPALVETEFSDAAIRHKVLQEIFHHSDWLELDRGTLQEDAAILRFSDRTGLSTSLLASFMEQVRASLTLIDEGFELLQHVVNTGHTAYCLSNMPTTTYAYLIRKYDFFSLFEDIVISGDIKLIKPDPQIFHYALKKFSITPNTAIFLDDRPENVNAARSLGINSHLFDPSPTTIASIKQSIMERQLALA